MLAQDISAEWPSVGPTFWGNAAPTLYLFVWSFSSHSRIFHSFGDVTRGGFRRGRSRRPPLKKRERERERRRRGERKQGGNDSSIRGKTSAEAFVISF